MRSRFWKLAAVVALPILAAFAAPYVLPPYLISLLALVLISSLLAGSVNILAGLAGLVSIGQAGIAAAGAYGVAWAAVRDLGVAPQLALALALVLLVSALYGLTTMRTRGIVFLMITLALGMVVFGLAFKLSSVTGGQNGLTGVDRPELAEEWWKFYYLTATVFGIALLALHTVGRSPFGLALRGIRDSESRMSSLGYSVAASKFVAVVISGLFAGTAGVLGAWNSQFVSPSVSGFSRSALAVIMVILGGTGTLLGPVAGAAVVVGAEHRLSSYVERWPTALGLVFILVVLFAPRGIVGEFRHLAGRLIGNRRKPRLRQPPRIEGAVETRSSGSSVEPAVDPLSRREGGR